MIKSVLFDTNIILDIALKREPHFGYATKLFSLIDRKEIIGHVTATTITDIYYIAKKEKGHESTLEFISDLIEVVSVIGVDRGRNSKGNSFRDEGLQGRRPSFSRRICRD